MTIKQMEEGWIMLMGRRKWHYARGGITLCGRNTEFPASQLTQRPFGAACYRCEQKRKNEIAGLQTSKKFNPKP